MKQILSINQLKRRYGRFRLLIAAIVMLVGCLYCGYWFGDQSLLRHKALIETQKQRLAALYRQSDAQLQQINFLQVEIEIEKQAGIHVNGQLQLLHQDNFKLQKELSFYQKIMAPELEAGGIEIDEFVVTPSQAKQIYHYKLVLVQTQKRKRYARGHITMVFKGTMNERSQRFAVEDLVEDFERKSLGFSFQYFQILEGDITLPMGFEPQNVLVSVVLPTGKWQKYERLDRQFDFLATPSITLPITQ